jgi:hypothetical protein
MKEFDGLEYTREALAEELSLVERHARDGSAVLGGCSCIEEKHLLLIAGLASEGVTLATDQAEKEYYMNLAEKARQLRLEILDGDFRKSQISQKSHSLERCERKIDACIAKGKSEEECRATIHCH